MQLALPFGTQPATPVFQYVRRRRARRYIVRVDGEGRVLITIPRGGSRRDGEAFGLRHLEWIAEQQAARRHPRWTAEEKTRHRHVAMAELPARVQELATRHGLTVSRVSIRDQRARWGSCGSNGHICLNWRLVLMPAWVRDYVIVHELMHLKRLDHSPRFWALVAEACADYRGARSWLREHGSSLR